MKRELTDFLIEKRLKLALGSAKRLWRILGSIAGDPRFDGLDDFAALQYRRVQRAHRSFTDRARSAR